MNTGAHVTLTAATEYAINMPEFQQAAWDNFRVICTHFGPEDVASELERVYNAMTGKGKGGLIDAIKANGNTVEYQEFTRQSLEELMKMMDAQK